jgi:hypothetical protein
MFSTVGPTSPWLGGSASSLQTQRASGLLPGAASASRGETGASGTRAESSERVDPATQTPAAPRTPDGERPGPRFRLLPQPATALDDPDDELAGPPPAFSRSLLEARRLELASPGPEAPRPGSPGGTDDDPLLATIRRIIAETGPTSAPPGPAERAEADFSALRRMESPAAPGTVDLSL